MSNEFVSAAPAAPDLPGLSQAERVLDAYVTPSKTFTDILRDSSWWLPFLLIALSGLASAFVVGRQVGFERASLNQVHLNPGSEERMNQLTPEQKARQLAISAKITMYASYGVPVILLAIYALYSLILWGAFNFGLGAQTTFGQVFAVSWYALLPYILTNLLVIVTLMFGSDADSYNMRNPVGTNIAYYLPDAAPWLQALLSQFDLIRLWSVWLQILGMAIIAKKTMMQSAMIVLAVWLIVLLFTVGTAAMTS